MELSTHCGLRCEFHIRTEGRFCVSDAQVLWGECCVLLREQVTQGVWMSTFREAEPLELADSTLVLTVPSSVAKEKLDVLYRALVEDALHTAAGADIGFGVEVRKGS